MPSRDPVSASKALVARVFGAVEPRPTLLKWHSAPEGGGALELTGAPQGVLRVVFRVEGDRVSYTVDQYSERSGVHAVWLGVMDEVVAVLGGDRRAVRGLERSQRRVGRRG